MTVDDIEKRLEEIARQANEESDDEMAHVEQDKLVADVLIAISEGVENAQELAEAAVKVYAIDFKRWYA